MTEITILPKNHPVITYQYLQEKIFARIALFSTIVIGVMTIVVDCNNSERFDNRDHIKRQ